MIQELAEVLAQQVWSHFNTIHPTMTVGGLATVWKSNTKDKQSKAVYWNYATQEHQNLVPDADKAAIVYFEELGSTRITNNPAGNYKADLALIGWVNTQKGINTPVLIAQIQQLFQQPLNAGVFSLIRVDFTELLPENEQLFSRYNYDTAVRKYLQKPYDAFGLRLSVTFNVVLC